MSRLENQVALITAATSKIGYTYAKHLLQNGVKVALCDVNLKDCQTVANELTNEFGVESILALECAVTDQMQLENAFTSCINRFGRLDIVVNNTAGMQIDLSIDERDEMNDAIMRVHYGGVVSGTLLAIKYMGAPNGGKGGTVVQTTCCESATSNVVGYTRVIGDVRSSNYLNIRTMALCPSPRNVSDNVGKALIYILEQGCSGQYWIVENEETPRLAE
ncbi:hypothetical protein ACI65C_009540 [Semiaphis heraclei]